MESNLYNILVRPVKIEARVTEVGKDIILAESEYGVILILNDRNQMVPMSLIVETIEDFREFGIRQNDRLLLDIRTIQINKRFTIDIDYIEVIDLRLEFKSEYCDLKLVARNLFRVEEFLYTYGKRSGMLPVIFNIGDFIRDLGTETGFRMYNNMYTSLMLPKVISLFEKLTQGRLNKTEICVKDIIDFGTENNNYSSGFLLGLLSSLVYAGQCYGLDKSGIVDLNELMVKSISVDRDNLYHNMLIESVDGGSPKIVLSTIEHIVFGDDSGELDKIMGELLKIKSISGTDTLCGIYLGIRLLDKEKFRKAVSNAI